MRHHRRRERIAFDFHPEFLHQTCANQSWRNACVEELPDFARLQSTQGRDRQVMKRSSCIRLVQRTAKKYPWFMPAARDTPRIDENRHAASIDEED
jgi:hypothetical protein